ncbi:MAG: hypothetical protein ACI4DW_03125 [Lachnospiraceae bacterium]
MDEKKTIFNYLEQVFMVYGFTMLAIVSFAQFVGEDARDFSTMFAWGRDAVPAATHFQFLLSSAVIIFWRFLFFSDKWIKKMSLLKRTAGMLLAVIFSIAVFIYLWGWFPVNRWQCWAMFFLCFGVSFAVSFLLSVAKERTENRQLERALKKMLEEDKKNGDH